MENKEFDYEKAMAELEQIAQKVEDPDTGLGDIDKYVRRSKALIAACRDYLRGVKVKVDALTEDDVEENPDRDEKDI